MKVIKDNYLNMLQDIKAQKRHSNHNVYDLMKKHKVSQKDLMSNVERACADLLSTLMIDWKTDPNSKDTPKRMAKMFIQETLRGRYEQAPNITTFPNQADLNQMLFIDGLRVESMCSHHHQNIRGTAIIGILYSSNGCVVGLSKYQRIIDWFARRPQIQEELTTSIGDFLWNKLKPLGLGITIIAEHQCMSCRGVNVQGSVTTSQKLYGMLIDSPEVRNEYVLKVNSYASRKN